MKKVTEFDKKTCREIAEITEAAIRKIMADRGLAVQYKGGTYAADEFTIKIRFAVMDETGKAKTSYEKDFELYCHAYGLAPEDLGREIRFNGRTCEIAGLKTRNHRYPIILKTSDGTMIKATAEGITRALAVANMQGSK